MVICHTVTSHRDTLYLTWKQHFNFFWPYVCLYKKPELFYFRIFENFICLDRKHCYTTSMWIVLKGYRQFIVKSFFSDEFFTIFWKTSRCDIIIYGHMLWKILKKCVRSMCRTCDFKIQVNLCGKKKLWQIFSNIY